MTVISAPYDLSPQQTKPAQAMMLIGLAGLGFAFRKSRRKVSFA
jgi:hypothetical protein